MPVYSQELQLRPYGGQVYAEEVAPPPGIDIAGIMPMVISLITVVMMFTMIIRMMKRVVPE